MNVYRVISEMLVSSSAAYDTHWDPPCEYCIAELVIARNRSQAKWLAWKRDKAGFTGNARDMPKMTVRSIRRVDSIDASPAVVSDWPDYQDCWGADES